MNRIRISARGCAKADVGPKDTVLILGAGTIALCAIDVVKARGAKAVIAARNPDRILRARRFEPDEVIDTSKEDLTESLNRITNGEGCDVILECTGARQIVESTIGIAGRASRIVFIGMCPGDISISHFDIINKELKIFGAQNSYGQFPWVLKQMKEGRFHEKELLSEVFDFTKAQEAFEYAIRNAGKCGKILLKFRSGPSSISTCRRSENTD